MRPGTLAILFELSRVSDEEFHAILAEAGAQRPWRPKRTGWVNVADQVMHAGYGAVVLLPLLLISEPIIGAAVSAGLIGAIREMEQYFGRDFKILMLGDRVVDVLFFVLGGGLLAWLL